jgi:hypothetical protein
MMDLEKKNHGAIYSPTKIKISLTLIKLKSPNHFLNFRWQANPGKKSSRWKTLKIRLIVSSTS